MSPVEPITYSLELNVREFPSYIHAQDLAHALYLVLHKAKFGDCYNIGPDAGISIRGLVQKIADRTGKCFEEAAGFLSGVKVIF